VTELLEGEIRTLRSLFWSDRDPEGRGFALLADAYRRAGDAKQALKLLGDGMGRHPDFTPGHVVAARLYVEQGLFAEAGLAARRVLDLDPENVDALRSLVRALDGEGEAVEAAKVREQLAILEPELAQAPAIEEAPAADDVSGVDDLSAVDEAALSTSVTEEVGQVEEAMDLSALAPEEPEVPGDEPQFDPFALGEVLHDEDAVVEDAVADFGALAPDEPAAVAEEEIADFGALAPDEPAAVAEEEIADFGALAPDEPAAVAEEEIADFGALAPDEPAAVAEEEIADFGALAPDEPAAVAEEEIADFGALAPDEPEVVAEEEIADFGVLAPDGLAEQIQTRTMADLYVTQGLMDRAIDVYENLVDAAPDDTELRARLERLRGGNADSEDSSGDHEAPAFDPGVVEQLPEAGGGDDVEVETLARDLAGSGDDEHEVDTPFAWGEEDGPEPADVAEGPSVGVFFGDLLSYGRASEADES